VTLLVGFVPVWLFLVRRPEDLGLAPDGQRDGGDRPRTDDGALAIEPAFSRREALRTPAFWLVLAYTVLVFPVQAGVSLHQAPYLIERGIDPTIAATIVSMFSLLSVAGSVACGFLPRGLPIRYPLAVAGMFVALGTGAMLGIDTAAHGYVAAAIFGFGIGAVLTLLPIAWADYFGRAHFGAIRGIALSAQVLAQAAGPLLSGALRDWSGGYQLALECFFALALASVLVALLARQPRLAAIGTTGQTPR
jgi:cyanate permease